MIGIVLQARLGSTRLPNKIILPFYREKSILEILIERLTTESNIKLIVATCHEKDNSIEKISAKYNIECYYGDKDDVLQRFIETAKYYNLSHVIRVCTDNPLIDIDCINTLIKNFNNEDDYISFRINGVPSILTHLGFWSELVSVEALERIASETSIKLYREHVTNYIYNNEDKFSVRWIDLRMNEFSSNIRLTIDTIYDFNIVKQIYELLINNKIQIHVSNIISFLQEKDNMPLIQMMKNNIITNPKI